MKSSGPDGSTNELLQHLRPSAKQILLQIYNASWDSASAPQAWREATMVPIHKKGKDGTKADNYRPISLTSCVGKLMERLINTRLTWHLEKKEIITPKQAGFRQHRSTSSSSSSRTLKWTRRSPAQRLLCAVGPPDRSTEDQVIYLAQEIEDAV